MKTKNLTQKLNFYELIGIILGDGCIYNYPKYRIYGLEISGNVKDDKEYFLKISNFIEKMIGKKPRISVRNQRLGKYLKLMIYSKKFSDYLINNVGISYKNKTYKAKIPEKFLDWKYSKHIIRGLFETDGSLYFHPRSKTYSYPRIELKTASKELANQIKNVLDKHDFKPKLRKIESDATSVISISGPKMLEKWSKEIGFGNIKSLSKYLIWKKFGHYINKISFDERLKILQNSFFNSSEGAQAANCSRLTVTSR